MIEIVMVVATCASRTSQAISILEWIFNNYNVENGLRHVILVHYSILESFTAKKDLRKNNNNSIIIIIILQLNLFIESGVIPA